MQDASGHKFTPCSRGWLLRLETFCADRCLTGGLPKSICYYELFNHYSISTAPLAPSLSTVIEKVRSAWTSQDYPKAISDGQDDWEYLAVAGRARGLCEGGSVDLVGRDYLVAERLPLHVNVVWYSDGLNSHHHETGVVHALGFDW